MKKRIIYFAALVIGSSFSVSGQNKGMGLKMDNKAYAKTPLIEKPLGFGANLPKSMSLKQYCPNIGDQGQTGTCTAWSSTYYAASMEYAILNNITNSDDVAKLAFDPYYTYLNIISEEEESKKTCEDGTFIGDACELLVQFGAKRKAFDMFDCTSKEYAVSNKEIVCPIDFTNYVRLSTQNWDGEQEDEFDVMITAVCQTLVNKHPVIIGMELLESFYNIGEDGKYDAANGGQESVGGHAMCVVGYDDNKFGGCFIVVNSWADGWGDKGFLYVTYKDFYKYVWYTYSLESEMKTFDATGCVGGDCEDGYGMMIYNTKKMKGTAEGIFSGGKMTSGIYTNLSGNISAKEIKMMEKFVKSNYGAELIYKDYAPIGYVDPY